MNWPTYLRELDRILSSLGEEAMRAYIEETAKGVSEDDREQFIASLSSFRDPQRDVTPCREDADIASEIDGILEKLDEINDGSKIIESRYNEEWLRTQSDEVEAYDFFSSDGVIEDLKKAVFLLHEAVDREMYQEGYILAMKLTQLEVEIAGDCEDSPFSLDLLCSCKILDKDIDTILKEALYLIYMGEDELRKRADTMVEIMARFKHTSLSFKEILECGEMESDVQSFLPFWIEALQKKPLRRSDKLIEEAVSMMDNRVVPPNPQCFS